MKIHVFAGISLVGMALTSAIVWSATSADSRGPARAASAPTVPEPPPPTQEPTEPAAPDLAVDRSVFTAGKTLMMEGRLGHAWIPSTTDSESYVFVEVKADPAAVATSSTRLELAIVIDRSGSMRGKRLHNAIEAAKTAIGRLRDGDVVSVLAYNTRTEVVVPSTVIGPRSRLRAVRGLERLRAKGDTCISCAVEAGARMLGDNRGAIARILLLSDGEATSGVRDVAGFAAIADRCRSEDIAITSIGVDLDYNERIMSTLAQRSNGSHYFAENATHLASIFETEMKSLEKTVAAGAEVHVSLAPGVILEHVYDREFRRTATGLSAPLGAFTAGEEKTLLLRVRVQRGTDGERAIASVALDYTDLVENGPGRCDGSLVAQATSDPARVSPLDGLVSMRISRSETAAALKDANALFRAGHETQAQGLLSRTRAKVERRHKSSPRPSSGKRVWQLDADFTRQGAVLDAAQKGFGTISGAGGGADKSADRAKRKQVKKNQKDAFDLGK